MSDMTDAIQDATQHARESKINSWVAIFVAFTATFMAICNIKDGNIVQAMAQAQARSIDTWSYFEAKSTKESITSNTLEMLKMQKTINDDEIKKYEDKISGYEKDKEQIKKEAEGYQKQYDDLNVFDDQFDMTEALLSISISLFGITALTQKKWLLYFGIAVCIIGFILGITAFMKISLHSNFVSGILG